jgi:FkbM family methyltransferase
MKKLKKYLVRLFIQMIPTRYVESVILLLESKIGIGTGQAASESGEKVVFEVLTQVISGPLMIFDVGANQGQYTSEALTQLRDQNEYSIHCFEPSLKTFKILNEVHGGNNKINLNNFGLAEKKDNSTLYMDAEGSGLASLTERKLDHFGIDHGRLKEEVELRVLDEYCLENNVKKINLLKIDVEGHELSVLSGAKSLLEKNGIDLIQFEFGGCNIDTRSFFQDFHYFFRDYGYEIYRILPSAKLLKLPLYREMDEKFRTTNFLAVSKALDITVRCRHLVI